MSNQYFENNDNLKSEEREIKFYFLGTNLKFIVDNGVFSKNNVDFGSSLLLRELIIKKETTKVLDVGCGYGPIGITIAKCHPLLNVDMVDINLRALGLAKKNATLNNVDNVTIFESNIYENVTSKYDLIITNPPIRAGKNIVHSILLEGYNYLNNKGSLWCVIQKKQGAESALKALKEKYQEVIIHAKDKLYYIIEAIKISE